MKWCTQTFPTIFRLFAIFNRNFVKIVAPPSNKNKNYLVHLKGQSLLLKNAENGIKIDQKTATQNLIKVYPSDEQRTGLGA